uniref:NPC1 middle luminal domain-containing protein n=1 Tax=Timema shepardi TaxID=629360 RepID=A0A7R9AUU3_TIMSH|nr:unnamed protein product [Timema shepardi]
MAEAYENKITASLNLMAMLFDKVKEAQDNPSDPLRLQLTQSFTQELTEEKLVALLVHYEEDILLLKLLDHMSLLKKLQRVTVYVLWFVNRISPKAAPKEEQLTSKELNQALQLSRNTPLRPGAHSLLHGWVSLTVSYLRGEGSDDVRHAVGQRLAGINHSRIALGADEEESPLQSKRSSVVSADEAMLSHRDTGRDASFFQRLGAGTDSLMERGFYSWGLVCASRPWLILFLGLCIIVGLGHGIKYMKMTTDPVELWASPHSRARVEREFFDSHFEPFYRTEQVIISAVGLPPIVHNTSNGPITFGPVYHREFLLAVKKLQEKIEAIGASDGGGLEKICFAPLTSSFTGPTIISQCTVQSIWGYFQDDMSLFNETDTDAEGFTVDYLDHIKACTQNAYNPNCMAQYGGPIDPAIALGGFLDPGQTLVGEPHYERATAIILTFLVNNHHNKTRLAPALEWERRY